MSSLDGFGWLRHCCGVHDVVDWVSDSVLVNVFLAATNKDVSPCGNP
jgi:hypothetical protein